MSTPEPSVLPDAAQSVAVFDRVAAYALDTLASVAQADLARPTPCPDWDLRTLLTHIADAARALTTRALTGEQTFPPLPQPVADDPAGHAAKGISELRDTLASAVVSGEPTRLDGARAAAMGAAIEFAAHAWDVAAACGDQRPAPEHIAADVLPLAQALVNDDLRARFFGPLVETGESAAPGDRFVAFVGRDPAWRPTSVAR